MKEHLTPKEFAEAMNISTQAVYAQMKTKLAPYVILVDGRKMIKAEALQSRLQSKLQSDLQPLDNDDQQVLENKEIEGNDELQSKLQSCLQENCFLKSQIAKQDKAIEEYKNEIRRREARIDELTDKLIEAENEAKQALSSNLALAMQTIALREKRQLDNEQPQSQNDVVETVSVSPVSDPDRQQEPDAQNETASQETPTNFWGRLRWLFGFKN